MTRRASGSAAAVSLVNTYAPVSTDRSAAGTLELPVYGPFDWQECLAYLGRSDLEVMHRISDGRLVQPFEWNGSAVLLEIGCASGPPAAEAAYEAASGAGTEPAAEQRLVVAFPHGRPAPGLRQAAAAYVRDKFGLGDDLEPFYAMARRDPLLSPVVSAHRGLRLIGLPDLFEALVWAIIGQQINLTFAYRLKKRLVEAYGEALPGADITDEAGKPDEPFCLFPKPAAIAALSPDDLRPMQFSVRKAEYVIGAARLIEAGDLSKSGLLALGEAEAREALLRIRGVGAWTADYVGMKTLRRASAFPAGDAGLHQALKRGLGLSRRPLPAEIAAAAAPWRGHEAYATFYLWQSLLTPAPDQIPNPIPDSLSHPIS
ncbi:DNA-3-methyladenine glycosylase 2 [Saccharibacillus brassicae]|uniref:DNA-3-methyladenine glycosylase II n=1 Tax=Saccharibacillus brassicae TaxID=2583377 RepID=A0A4Y6UUI6_SACBS|nr:DNA-3-methyladenine glycosylase 2 [Saccharibacillus brassicae]QDH20218.1 DNA-3-methyladenine glycosylase 2 [Saccharibacillus brassicae]